MILTQTLTTDASGFAQLSYVGPTEATTGDDPPVVDEVSAFWVWTCEPDERRLDK